MTEVANMLAQTGDVISEAGLANLADWKHGVQNILKVIMKNMKSVDRGLGDI